MFSPHNRQTTGEGLQLLFFDGGNPNKMDTNKPKDTCSFCGGNHTARNCCKRQNEEKKDGVVRFSTPPHKQANLNLQIDEASMMFSQSVVSVTTPDSNNSQPSFTC